MDFHLDEIRWLVYGFAGLILIGSGMALYFLIVGWEEVKTIVRDIRDPWGWQAIMEETQPADELDQLLETLDQLSESEEG